MVIQNPTDIVPKLLTDDGRTVKIKIVDIGTWNMQGSATKLVAHGLGAIWDHILDCVIVVRNDTNTERLCSTFVDTAGGNALWNDKVDATNVNIRNAQGFFNSPNFSSVAFTRGYIVLTYFL
jgi:hypothetical protein